MVKRPAACCQGPDQAAWPLLAYEGQNSRTGHRTSGPLYFTHFLRQITDFSTLGCRALAREGAG